MTIPQELYQTAYQKVQDEIMFAVCRSKYNPAPLEINVEHNNRLHLDGKSSIALYKTS